MERLAAQMPKWALLAPDTPEPIVACQCAIARNLSDFVFPACCIDDERRAMETRALDLLNKQPSIPKGAYYSIGEMDAVGQRFLAERRLITYEMLCAAGPRGVYASEDQSFTIMINASDHIVIRSITASGKLEDAWNMANDADNALGDTLDFSYHERLGYLTRSLRMVGTGLKASVLLHLPGLVMTSGLYELEQRMSKRRLQLCGMSLGDPRVTTAASPEMTPGSAHGLTAIVEPAPCQCLYTDILGELAAPTTSAAGNLFLLRNQDTLGLSEAEIIFHTEQAASEIVAREEEARQDLMRERKNAMLDSIGRALGIASSARQMGMGEALILASLIRFANAQGVMAGFDGAGLNSTLLECQGAHLQIMRDASPDAQLLAEERARLFRTLFSGTTIN